MFSMQLISIVLHSLGFFAAIYQTGTEEKESWTGLVIHRYKDTVESYASFQKTKKKHLPLNGTIPFHLSSCKYWDVNGSVLPVITCWD